MQLGSKEEIMINVGVIAKGQKKIMHVKKIIFGDPATCSCENVEYLFIDDSVVTCDEIIEGKTKTITKKFIEKNALCKTKNFCILLAS